MKSIYFRTLKEGNIKEIEAFKVGCWINIEKPSDDEVSSVASEYNLDPGLLKDSLDEHEVPRLEVDEGIIYIFTRIPVKVENRVLTTPLLIVLANDFLLTLSPKKVPFINKLLNQKDLYTTQKIKLLINLFVQINSSYNNFLLDISRQVRNVVVRLEGLENKEMVKFVAFEGVINDFLSSLIPTNTILTNLLSGKYFKLFENDKDLIEDLFLSNGQLIDVCRSTLKTIVNIREAYSAIMSHNVNRSLKLLAALTIITTLPLNIASLYGMNVNLPLASHPAAFWIIVLLMVVSSVLLALIFIKNRWM